MPGLVFLLRFMSYTRKYSVRGVDLSVPGVTGSPPRQGKHL
jgi:hypothetical protein